MKKCLYCGKYIPETKADEKAIKKNLAIKVEMVTCNACLAIIQMHENLNFKDN